MSPKCECSTGYYVDENDRKKCIKNETYVEEGRCDESTQFECKRNRHCIDRSLLCDGDDDCLDGSDEDNKEGGICQQFKVGFGSWYYTWAGTVMTSPLI